jgi:hypothetical protein
MYIFATNPRKNTTAIDVKINAILRLLFFCSDVTISIPTYTKWCVNTAIKQLFLLLRHSTLAACQTCEMVLESQLPTPNLQRL